MSDVPSRIDTRQDLEALLARKPDFTIAFAREHLYYYRKKEKLEHYLDGLRIAGVPED